MTRLHKLTDRMIRTTAKRGRYSDGGCLYFVVGDDGSRRWSFMFSRGGRQREAGLGSIVAVSLAQARGKAAEYRSQLAAGEDPIDAKKAARTRKAKPSFGECAEALITANSPGWRSEIHRAQWVRTLRTYAKPLWALRADEVTTATVLAVLWPIWHKIPETASRLRGRIEAVIDAARAHGHIPTNEANPARWKGHLDHLLAKRQKVERGHYAAMPYANVPGFIGRLHELQELSKCWPIVPIGPIGHLALEFAILTVSRTGETLGARWDEVDLASTTWVIPATRMKGGREHRVPLSPRAVELLSILAATTGGTGLVFPGLRPAAMSSVLKSMKVEGATVHGFRSSFADWAAETTTSDGNVVEGVLAHSVGSAVSRAYRRTDILARRRALLDEWGRFCTNSAAGSNVIRMLEARAG